MKGEFEKVDSEIWDRISNEGKCLIKKLLMVDPQ